MAIAQTRGTLLSAKAERILFERLIWFVAQQNRLTRIHGLQRRGVFIWDKIMEKGKLIFAILATSLAMSFAICETKLNSFGRISANSNLKSKGGGQKNAPTSRSPSRQNPAAAANWDIASLDTARKVDYLSEIEKDVILEMNKARSDPKKYAETYLVPFAKRFRSDGTYIRKGGTVMLTREGVAAVNECIKEMSAKKPVGILKPAKGLSLAAQGHATSQAEAGQIGHTGTDGSTPFTRIQEYADCRTAGENISYGAKSGLEIVVQLLVDDGVPDRGHRKNIFNPAYTRTGVGYAEGHKAYGTECVITYAGGYQEKN